MNVVEFEKIKENKDISSQLTDIYYNLLQNVNTLDNIHTYFADSTELEQGIETCIVALKHNMDQLKILEEKLSNASN